MIKFLFLIALTGVILAKIGKNQCAIPKLPPFSLIEFEYHTQTAVCNKGSIEKFLSKNLDIFLMDGHDGSLYHWLHKLDRTKKYTLVHIDSHNDMDYPSKMNMKMFESNNTNWAKDAKIHIGNFILPFVYAGLINRIIWVKPEWESINPSHDEFQVGNIPGTDAVACNSNLYFMEYHNKQPLENPQNVTLDVIHINRFDLPDLNIRNDNILLDIDLDYFATQNPLEKWLADEFELTQAQIFRLASIFDTNSYCWNRVSHFPPGLLDNYTPMATTDKYSKTINKMHTLMQVLMAQFFPKKKGPKVSDEEYIEMMSFIMHLWCVDDVDMQGILLDVKHLVEYAHSQNRTLHKNMAHPHLGVPSVVRMLDSIVNLPHHFSKPDEIEEMKKDLFLWLDMNGINKVNPKKPIITIAKSQIDGHSFPHLVEYVLNNVVYDILYRLYH